MFAGEGGNEKKSINVNGNVHIGNWEKIRFDY